MIHKAFHKFIYWPIKKYFKLCLSLKEHPKNQQFPKNYHYLYAPIYILKHFRLNKYHSLLIYQIILDRIKYNYKIPMEICLQIILKVLKWLDHLSNLILLICSKHLN